jgi:hypothetical protein
MNVNLNNNYHTGVEDNLDNLGILEEEIERKESQCDETTEDFHVDNELLQQSSAIQEFIEKKDHRGRVAIAVGCAAYFIVNNSTTWNKVIGRSCNQETINYDAVVLKINNLKLNQPLLFTRMYRLSPESFDRILEIIRNNLIPWKTVGKNCVPPMIKLCIGLRILAGGSYLDILFGYNVPHNVVHHYGWQALHAI